MCSLLIFLIYFPLKDEPEQQAEERQGRAKTRRSLVDWAWENVDGKTENVARERRSLSRERGIQRDVGEIVADVSVSFASYF